MKNRRNFISNPGVKGEEQVFIANVSPTIKAPEPVYTFTGLMQENYVNTRYLETGMTASISNMSFGGLWL